MPGPRRIILGIETSNPSAATEPGEGPGVALGELAGDDPASLRILGVERLMEPGRHDDDLMPAIDRLTRRVGVRPRDLARVAVSAGPGGYTALRIAVTTAKLIAEATGAACVAVPSARVVARRVRHEGRAFGVAIASKGETAYLTMFDGEGRAASAGRLVGAGDVGEWVESERAKDAQEHASDADAIHKAGGPKARHPFVVAADRFLPAGIRAELTARGVRIDTPIFEPAACIEACLGLQDVDPVALAPIYPREPEAVTKWRLLHPPA